MSQRLSGSERAAHQARDEHAEQLRAKGAHALSVERVDIEGKRRFAVVASVERHRDGEFPNSLRVTAGTKTNHVPLVVRVEPQFSLD